MQLNPMMEYVQDNSRMCTYTMSSNAKNCNELVPLAKNGSVHVVGDKLFIHISSWETCIVDPTTMETLKTIDLRNESNKKLHPVKKTDVYFDMNTFYGMTVRNMEGQLVLSMLHGHFKELKYQCIYESIVYNRRIYVSHDNGKVSAYNLDGTGFHQVMSGLFHRTKFIVYRDMLLIGNGSKLYMFDKYEQCIKTIDGILDTRVWALVGDSIWNVTKKVTKKGIVVTRFNF